jgi:hypothetical protein
MWNASPAEIALSSPNQAQQQRLQHNQRLDIHPVTWNFT